MIWIALFSAYCLACAAWALCEAHERAELRRTIQRRLNGLKGGKS